jgi:hypothetical protein
MDSQEALFADRLRQIMKDKNITQQLIDAYLLRHIGDVAYIRRLRHWGVAPASSNFPIVPGGDDADCFVNAAGKRLLWEDKMRA